MPARILVADDDPVLQRLLLHTLKLEGYDVVTASDGNQTLEAVTRDRPDLVILDVMMPEMDGWSVARAIRKESDVPLIFLTARIDDIDQVTGLEIGADEYVTKPFSPRVLVARVRALLRRTHGELGSEPTRWRVRELELDADMRTVTVGGRPVELTPSEFGVLQVLIARPGRVFTRMELLDQLQGEAYAAYERTIDVHVKNLRSKLERDPRTPEYVETVYGVGYRMRPDTA